MKAYKQHNVRLQIYIDRYRRENAYISATIIAQEYHNLLPKCFFFLK